VDGPAGGLRRRRPSGHRQAGGAPGAGAAGDVDRGATRLAEQRDRAGTFPLWIAGATQRG
jgi:hypothetical protein